MTVRFPSFAFAAQAPDIFRAPTEAVGMLGDIQRIREAAIKGQYLGPLLQQQLQQEQLKTQTAQVVAPYAGPEEQAKLAQMQATPALTRAQTQQALANAKKLSDQIYKDPTISRLTELTKALKRHDISQNILQASGLGGLIPAQQQAAQQVTPPVAAPIVQQPVAQQPTPIDYFHQAIQRGLNMQQLQLPTAQPQITPQVSATPVAPTAQQQPPVRTIPSPQLLGKQIASQPIDEGYMPGKESTQSDISNFLLTGQMMTPATVAALKASSAATAKAASMALAGEKKIASAGADNANNSLDQIDDLESAYKNAYKKYETGIESFNPANAFRMLRTSSVMGFNRMQNYAASLDPNLSNALRAQRALALEAIKQVHLGRMTYQEFQYIQSVLPTFGMNPQAFMHSLNLLRVRNERNIQYNKFIVAANARGITDVSTIKALWSDFIHDNRVINVQTGEINKTNIDNWQKYLSKDAVQNVLRGKSAIGGKNLSQYSSEQLMSIARG